MSTGVAHRFSTTTSSWQSTSPLPQIPLSTFQPLKLPQDPGPATPGQPFGYFFACDPSIGARSFDPKTSIQHVSPASGTQTSVGTPVASVGSSGKRKGPPEVQWDASTERKYARLYSLSDADIDDLPIILRDKKLKFQ